MVLEPLKDLSLAATAALIVVLIDHFVTIRKVADEVSREIEARLVDVMEMFIWGSKDAGLIRFHKRLDFSRLFEELDHDDELLWLDTYCPLNSEFADKVRPAIERGARVRMLIIDPNCATAEFRASEIMESETFAQEVQLFAKRISAISCNANNHNPAEETCQILAYDDLPCLPMYIVHHKGVPVRGYSGFFLTKPSAFFTHLEWTYVNGGVLENMHAYFEQKWEKHLRRSRDFPRPAENKALQAGNGSRQKKLRSLQSA
jgi:hypothetical protein